MKEFKFLNDNIKLLHNGREIVFVGPITYDPFDLDAVRRIHYIDDDGYKVATTVNDTHPLWERFRSHRID
jgi:hypothetical protein